MKKLKLLISLKSETVKVTSPTISEAIEKLLETSGNSYENPKPYVFWMSPDTYKQYQELGIMNKDGRFTDKFYGIESE